MAWWILSLLVGGALAMVPPKNSQSLFHEWSAQRQPTAGPADPIGTYAAGCLAGAVPVPIDGVGYAAMRLKRHRLWGHQEMLAYLNDLGQRLKAMKMPLLLIGDIGDARGGPMLNGHNSHQIGLDADLWLRMSARRPNRRERETWSAPSFVKHRKRLLPTWGDTQIKLITAAADSPLVNRIFVSPPIKRYFCAHAGNAPWLYKLRAWWGHEEHIHVRLNCPNGATHCAPQAPLNPTDNGCGAKLAWWFSPEADQEWAKLASNKAPREFPDLPAACGAVIQSAVAR